MLGDSGIWYPIIHMVGKRDNCQDFVEWGHLHILFKEYGRDWNVLLHHALSPYEEDPWSFWERLVSSQKTNITSYVTDLGEDGVRRCRLMVDLGSRVMSKGN